MIDVRIIAKKKTSSGSGTTGTGGMHYSGGSSGGSSATSNYASRAGYAETAGKAAEATHASSAGALDAGSPTREDFVSATHADEAAGEIAFEDGIKLGSHDSSNGIDKDGNATLESVTANSGTIDKAEIHQLCDDIKNALLNRTLVGGKGFEMYIDAQGKSHLWVDDLMVRVKAYFASLEIRKVSYSGGTTIFSNAGSTICKVAEILDGNDEVVAWKCYAKADDGTTATMNYWKVGMQALCQTFNIKAGKYENVSNRYYWRLVVGVGQEALSDGYTYDYVILSNVEAISADDTAIPDYTHESTIGIRETATTWSALEWGDTGTASVRALGWTSLSDILQDEGISTTKTSFKGYDASIANDAPAVGDVIVQVGDQVQPKRYGHAVKITTSREDGSDLSDLSDIAQGSSLDMYTGIDDYDWEEHWLHAGPDGFAVSASMFKLIATDGVKSITEYIDDKVGHSYKIETDSEMVIASADAESKIKSISQVSGLPTDVFLTDNGNVISAQDWTSAYITIGGKRFDIDTSQALQTGILPTFKRNGANASISWMLCLVTTTQMTTAYAVSAGNIGITINFKTESGSAATITKEIPLAVTTDGTNGTSVTIKGSVSSVDDLPKTGNTVGDGYLVDGVLYVWTADGKWVSVGQIKGDKGDSAWTFAAQDLVLRDEDLTLNSDGTYDVATNTNTRGLIEAYYGAEKAAITAVAASPVSNMNEITSFKSGSYWYYRPNLLAATTQTEDGQSVTMPVGKAMALLKITAESTDAEGNAVSETRSIYVNVSVVYTQHVGTLTLTNKLFEVRMTAAENGIKTNEATITATAKNISLVVQYLNERTGIDIENGRITFTANRDVFVDSDGNEIAVFDSTGINAKLITARHIYATNASGTRYGHFGYYGDADNNTDYPLWLGAETPTDAPFSVDYTGAMTATAGTIGGFQINKDSIGTNLTGVASSAPKMWLTDTACHQWAGYGSGGYLRYNWLSSDTGKAHLRIYDQGASTFAYGASIDLKCAPTTQSIGVAVSATGGTEGRTSAVSPETSSGNYSFVSNSGQTIGFRPGTIFVDSNTELSHLDNVIVCANTSTINLKLPSSPMRGQMYIIMTGDADVTLVGDSSHKLYCYGHTSGETSWTMTLHWAMVIAVYDGAAWQIRYNDR